MRIVNIKQKAFTVVEILVVMMVLSILIGLSVVGITSIQRSSRDSARKNNLRQVQIAMESFYNQSRKLPVCTNVLNGCDLQIIIDANKSAFASAGLSPNPDTNFSKYKYFTDGKNVYNVTVSLEDAPSECNKLFILGGISNVEYKTINANKSYPSKCWTI